MLVIPRWLCERAPVVKGSARGPVREAPPSSLGHPGVEREVEDARSPLPAPCRTHAPVIRIAGCGSRSSIKRKPRRVLGSMGQRARCCRRGVPSSPSMNRPRERRRERLPSGLSTVHSKGAASAISRSTEGGVLRARPGQRAPVSAQPKAASIARLLGPGLGPGPGARPVRGRRFVPERVHRTRAPVRPRTRQPPHLGRRRRSGCGAVPAAPGERRAVALGARALDLARTSPGSPAAQGAGARPALGRGSAAPTPGCALVPSGGGCARCPSGSSGCWSVQSRGGHPRLSTPSRGHSHALGPRGGPRRPSPGLHRLWRAGRGAGRRP